MRLPACEAVPQCEVALYSGARAHVGRGGSVLCNRGEMCVCVCLCVYVRSGIKARCHAATTLGYSTGVLAAAA